MLNVSQFISKSRIQSYFLSALLFAAPIANATIYSLGDSLSDTGALGFTYTNPVKLSPLVEGNVWVQYITNSVPAFCNDPKHCKFDDETFYYSANGNNYAVGGAGVTFDSTDATLAVSYTSLHFQIEALVHNHKLGSEDVVTVWMGANDIFEAALTNPLTSPVVVKQVAQVFTNEIAALAKTGAKIYILNIPDLGLIPLGLSTSDGGALLSHLTIIFNEGIAGLAKVKNISLVDSNALMAQLLSANQFDTTEIYCPAIIDPTHICGDSLTNPELVNSPQVPYFFADPIHPSFAAHKVIGQAIQKLIHKKTQ